MKLLKILFFVITIAPTTFPMQQISREQGKKIYINPHQIRYISKNMPDNYDRVINAWLEDKKVGSIVCKYLKNNNWHIDSLWVEKEYREYGIGATLFLECFKDVVIQKAHSLEWSVISSDERYMTGEKLFEWYIKQLNTIIKQNIFGAYQVQKAHFPKILFIFAYKKNEKSKNSCCVIS